MLAHCMTARPFFNEADCRSDVTIRSVFEFLQTLEDPITTVSSPHHISQLLAAWSGGNQSALDELIPLVEAELRRRASNFMRKEGPGHTLQTTEMINEAYIKLIGQ